MIAQQLQSLDGADGLRLTDVPEPDDQGSVIIEVHATGVGFPELLYTQGRYQTRPELPFIPGAEVAGRVLRAPHDSGFVFGQRVCACTLRGGWAQRAAASPALTFALNPALDWAEGAALVVNYQTAHFALSRRGRLQAGEWLLVHGAAGGVGSAAVQVGVGLGARVVAVVSTEQKAAAARRAGAHETVLFGDGWAARARELTGGGADMVLDPVGGSRFVDSLRSLAPEGRLVVVGFAAGEIPELRVNRLLLTNTDVVGAAWGPWARASPPAVAQAARALDRMIDSGAIRPAVGPRFALADAPLALGVLERREALGKVILDVEQ